MQMFSSGLITFSGFTSPFSDFRYKYRQISTKLRLYNLFSHLHQE